MSKEKNDIPEKAIIREFLSPFLSVFIKNKVFDFINQYTKHDI